MMVQFLMPADERLGMGTDRENSDGEGDKERFGRDHLELGLVGA